ncbi:MAG: XdhC family protein [Pyrinomonadaceae bacterium]
MPSPVNKAESTPISAAISRILQEGSIAVLATLIEATADVGSIGAKLLVEESEGVRTAIGSLGSAELDESVARHAARFLESREETRVFQMKEFAAQLVELGDTQILFERIQQEPRLVICGAGHVGASLARLAALMGYRATLIDDRGEFVRRELFPDKRIDLIAISSWTEAVRDAVGDGRGVSVAVVTRGHSEDEQCMGTIIGTGADYIGLIGSKRRTNIVLGRLRENGAEEEKLKHVRAPIGLDIGAVTPEEVALAIMAEIVAVRRGGIGGSLSEWRRRR